MFVVCGGSVWKVCGAHIRTCERVRWTFCVCFLVFCFGSGSTKRWDILCIVDRSLASFCVMELWVFVSCGVECECECVVV